MTIPQCIFQTSLSKPPLHVIRLIQERCEGWEYRHFTDNDIIQFFKSNPIDEFKHIHDKFLSFSNGAHKADLFRYYYLYLNGGVFLDSDAMLEQSIEDIIRKNRFVSIKSYHKNKNLLFNGFLAATPKHPIIYQALKHLYNTNDSDLKNDYFLVCKQLLKITFESNDPYIHLHQEQKDKKFLLGTKTYNEKNELILTHYCQFKSIPDFTKKITYLELKLKNNIIIYKLLKKISKLKKKIRRL